jgi:hypothetical protein
MMQIGTLMVLVIIKEAMLIYKEAIFKIFLSIYIKINYICLEKLFYQSELHFNNF